MGDFYTIISGTNRVGSNTMKIAKYYADSLESQGATVKLLSLEKIQCVERNQDYVDMERDFLIPATKFIFISPEYQGSIPGILKLMLDNSDYKKVWWGKKALLTGVAIGRSGNLRGMEHLTSILHYLRVIVHHNKLPISSVDKMIDGNGVIHDPGTLKAINAQLEEFVAF